MAVEVARGDREREREKVKKRERERPSEREEAEGKEHHGPACHDTFAVASPLDASHSTDAGSLPADIVITHVPVPCLQG